MYVICYDQLSLEKRWNFKINRKGRRFLKTPYKLKIFRFIGRLGRSAFISSISDHTCLPTVGPVCLRIVHTRGAHLSIFLTSTLICALVHCGSSTVTCKISSSGVPHVTDQTYESHTRTVESPEEQVIQ